MPTAAIPFVRPKLWGIPGIDSPAPRSFYPAVGALFQDGDFVKQVTTGTIVNLGPTGSMATLAGPAASAVTLATSASAGAPAYAAYIVVTYTASANESLPSQEFLLNVPAGFVPTVNVASAGAPAAADHFAAYIGVYSGGECLQQATKTTTALGATYTAANPLTNSSGINRCATNDASSAKIVGLALHDALAVYGGFVGGSANAGGFASRLGAMMPPGGLAPADSQKVIVANLTASAPFEITLKQPWTGALEGSTAGLLLDTSQDATGIFVADTSQSNKIVTLVRRVDVGGNTFDTGARILAYLNGGAV